LKLEELRQSGLELIDVLRRRGEDASFKELLTNLYPHKAHFIFELLQNAEDARDKNVIKSAGASVVRFVLNESSLEFEHNGDGLFSYSDVKAITSFSGKSTKINDPTSIGKFGIGFKSVFAYTNTPEIHSGEFHFRIHDLVVPEPNGVTRPRMGERETRFIFPFDNPKKPSKKALTEIEEGLRALGDNTLLFLSHIRKIEYLLPDGSLGALERIDHKGGRIEIRASHPGGSDTVSHWLRFQKEVEVVDEDAKPKTCRIAVAYSIVEEKDKKKRKSTWKIIPLDRGQVSIYFPADKETSNLRFHLHAPFASTVARDSVRECKANQHLCSHVADLIVESLFSIRDQDLLTVGFLAVMPNIIDNLPPFYEPIRTAIVHAFKNESLTPTKCGTHAKASGLYRGPAKIVDVLNDDDLSLLTSCDPPLWAANPPQQNQREDRFLDSLKINEWGWSEIARAINKPYSFPYSDQQREENTQHKRRIEDWIVGKDDAWLMRFYALLGEVCETHYKRVDVSTLRIVRVETDHSESSEHIAPEEAFFPPNAETTPPTNISFVKPTVYSTGKAEERKKFAYSFLEKSGVRLFDAKAVIELKLAQYKSPPTQVRESYYKDIKQFIAYWKKNPNEGGIFSNKTFLLGVSHDNELYWLKPDQLCLDNPYIETGLSEMVSIHGKIPIYDSYKDKLSETHLKDFTAFLKMIGIMHELEIKNVGTHENPHTGVLWQDRNRHRTKWTSTAINEDYSISYIDKYLDMKSVSASCLLWDALIHASSKSAKARCRPNQQYPIREVESQLVYHLKRHAWIPDKSGDFKKPQDMTKDDLRIDFPYDDRNGLLTAIGVGENAKKQCEEYKARDQSAKDNGFDSAEELAKWLKVKEAGIPPEDILAQYTRRVEQPSESVRNPERRRKRVLERRENAPTKESVSRERAIQPGVSSVVAEAKAYLRAKYTNSDKQLICQCCHAEMPFKIVKAHYFEAIQCVRGLDQHHFENRLALCPTCAAMYQHARETDDKAIQHDILHLDADDTASSVEISVKLAGREFKLLFVGTHWFDLKTILSK